jgi:hypothetical protein
MLWTYSWGWLGQGGVRRGAAPAARPGGRRGLCAGEVGSMQRAWGGWQALVGAGKGGGKVDLARSRPEPGARRGCQQWRRRRLGPGGWASGAAGKGVAAPK